MRCQVQCSDMQAAVDFIGHALGDKRSPLPILSYVLADIKDGQLTLQSTDTEIAASYRLPVTPDSMGHWRAAIPGRLFIALFDILSDELIELKAEALTLTVQSKTTTSRLNCLPAEDFPAILQEEGKSWHIPLAELQRLLRTVIYAAAKEDSPELMGVLFEVEPGGMTLVATNRARLAMSSISCPTPDQSFQFILPIDNCQTLLKMLAKEDGNVEITRTENHVWFKTDKWEIFSTSLQGKYPDYKSIIPNSFSTVVHFDANELMLACRQALLFAKDINNTVRLSIIEDGLMTVCAEGGQSGEGKASLPVELEGNPINIAFNGMYLKDMLQTMDGRVTLRITPAGHIGVFEHGHSQHLIASLKMS